MSLVHLRPSRIAFSLILTSLILLTSISESKAQAAILALLFGDKVASENFNLSMELGFNYSEISNLEDERRRVGALNFGIAGNARLAKNWFLSPNIYFLSRRRIQFNSLTLSTGNPSVDNEFVNVPASLTISYIDVPVLVYYQTKNKKFRFGTGPQISFMQNTVVKYEGSNGEFEQNINEFVNKSDLSAMIDFAYILGKAHKGKGIHLHLRFSQGFSDVFDSNGSTPEDHNQLSFYSFHISLPFITEELAAKNLEEY